MADCAQRVGRRVLKQLVEAAWMGRAAWEILSRVAGG